MKHSNATPRFGRKTDVCRILACGPTHVYRLIQDGKLRPIRQSRRMTLFDMAEVHALADRMIAKARKDAAA